MTRALYKDLTAKNFLTSIKIRIPRIYALDAILIRKVKKSIPVRRFTVDENNVAKFFAHSTIANTSTSVTETAAKSPPSRGDSTSGSHSLFSFMELKTKSILKKPTVVPIGARSRKSTCAQGCLQSDNINAENPFSFASNASNGIEKAVPARSIAPIEPAQPILPVEHIETAEAA